MKSHIAVSLGHNSSAILIEGGRIQLGFEEERFTLKKADSSFPYHALDYCAQRAKHPIELHIGHWYLDSKLPKKEKHIDWNAICKYTSQSVNSVTPGFSHHDSHMQAAEVFAGADFPREHFSFVLDGFGSTGECISIYKKVDGFTSLVHRTFGFNHSLGLLYQYATAFLNMRMHQDEYKLLGYETMIEQVLTAAEIGQLQMMVDDETERRLKGIFNHALDAKHDPMSMSTALMNTRAAVEELLNGVIRQFKPFETMEEVRVVVAYFVQAVVETVVGHLVKIYAPKNIILSGGLFYNVKLNSLIADLVPGKTCIYPIAGDQGAALGVYQHKYGDLQWPGHVFWGQRGEVDCEWLQMPSMRVRKFAKDMQAHETLRNQLRENGMVNLIRGNMEFGPRALCNTSTLAIPTMENVERINAMNNRNTVMPMALVMEPETANDLFDDCDKIHKSLEYMVCTRQLRLKSKADAIRGGLNYYPLHGEYTCRPQVTTDPLISALTEEFGPLINTSLNAHGQPIVFNGFSIAKSLRIQNSNQVIDTVLIES